MAALNVKLPAVKQSFYASTDIPQIKTQLSIITRLYSGLVGIISKATKVPAELIYAFMFIESRGEQDAYNSGSGATGLMQVTPFSATDIVVMENRAGRLTEPEKAILYRNLGKEKFDTLMGYTQLGQKQVITKDDLFKPELNILVGAILMGILIDEHTEGGTTRLDKVVVRYNMGYYAYSKGSSLTGNINNIMVDMNTQSKNYILQLLGTNGILDILV